MGSKVQDMLRDLNATAGIHESVIVGRDGFVIEHLGDMDADGVGATISTAMGTIEAMGRDTDQGSLFEVMAEYNGGTIIAAPVGRDAVLGIVAESDANLGGIRHAVKKSLRDLERAL
jgi:uncharacterized protein